MANVTTDDQWLGVPLVIEDARGKPALVDGVPVYASSDATVLAVTPSADGMSVDIVTVAPGGPARVTVSADADRGAGNETITGVTEDIIVTQGVAGKASVLRLALPTPTQKP